MPVRTFAAVKDVAVRSSGASWSDTPREGAGGREHLYAGKLPKRLHRSFIDFAFDFSNIKLIQRADLVLHTSEEDNDVLPEAQIRVHRVTSNWAEGGSTDFVAGNAVNPTVATGKSWTGHINNAVNAESRIDITELVGMWAPKTVRWINGGGQRVAGGDEARKGIRIEARDESIAAQGFEVWSQEAGVSTRRPRIEIAYLPPNSPPDLVTTIDPSGTVLPGTDFHGEFADPDDDRPEKIQIQVRKASNEAVVWDKTTPFDPLWFINDDGHWEWTVANPGTDVLKADIAYEWRVRGYDPKGNASDWSNWRAFTQHGTAPTATLVPIVDAATLVGTEFVVLMTVGDDSVPTSVRVQLRTAGLVNWDDTQWDEPWLPLEAREISEMRASRPYGGRYLGPGSYEWRAMVFDSLGRSSAWSATDTFTLTIGSEVDDEGGGTGPPLNTTGYARVRGPVRVVLRDMGPDRAPGVVKAIIEDPANLGCSTYVNEPGELYFTLPATHPQASECEPYQRHYAVQQYRNGNWRDIANGILTDFDATADDVVIYGIDYLGFLSLSIDTRFPPGESTTDLNKKISEGGSRYADETIDDIIEDQLRQAKDDADSPLGFFHIGHMDDLSMGGLLSITIYSSFVQRLDFIRGLLESYRQGTGIRSRLKARKDPAQADRWEWDLRGDPGVDRAALRMEYGSLVQGFRVIGFGDTFGTRIHGIGRKTYASTLIYHMWPEKGDSDDQTSRYGNIAKAHIWQDLIDENDLKRRVRQMYQESVHVGKRIALGLRVHSLQPWDGFDLTDNIPLNIDRGMVDTQSYGSGWWTIWGQEWRVFPDGHDELTLVIRPKEDGEPADPDLLPSRPTPTQEFCVGHGPPTDPCACATYLDIDANIIYTSKPGDCDEPEIPEPWSPHYLLFDDFERFPPGPCWDSSGVIDWSAFLSGCIIMDVTQGYTSGTSHSFLIPKGAGYAGGVLPPEGVDTNPRGREVLLFQVHRFDLASPTGGDVAALPAPWVQIHGQVAACTHGFPPFNNGHPTMRTRIYRLDVDSNPGFYGPDRVAQVVSSPQATNCLWIAVSLANTNGLYVGPNSTDWNIPVVPANSPAVAEGKQALYLIPAFNRYWNNSEHGLGLSAEDHNTSIVTGSPLYEGTHGPFGRIAIATGGDLTLTLDVGMSEVAGPSGLPSFDPGTFTGTGGSQDFIINRILAVSQR